MSKAFLILILLAICLPAFAIGKVTTDPNTSAAPQKTEVSGDDARLSQKVTISESRKLVSVILEDLTKQTGVVFRAGYNSNDWQVRDRRMSIFAKDVPLAQIMNSISHVMKFKWDRKGDEARGATGPLPAGAAPPSKWTYRLYMDRKSLLDADSQKLREDERLRQKIESKRQSLLESYENADKMTKVDLAKLKADDPMTYVLATAGVAGSLGQMLREVPSLSESLASGESITLANSDMPPTGQAGLRRLTDSILNFARKIAPPGNPIPSPSDVADQSLALELNPDSQNQSSMLGRQIILAEVRVRIGDNGSANFPLFDPGSSLGRTVGEGLILCDEGKLDLDKLQGWINARSQAAVQKDATALDKEYGEPVVQHQDVDPALKVKIKSELDGNKLADVEKALAQASGFAVVSDSFYKKQEPYDFVKNENELGVDLDKVAKAAFYNWDKKALVIEFRDREWFRNRTNQIPEATIERWRQNLRETGTLDLPELAEIARLDQEQFNMNLQEDDFLGEQKIGQVIMLYRDVLRLYGSFTDNQRSAMMSDSGLDLRDLTPEQSTAATNLIKARCVRLLANPDAQVILKITGKPDGKQIHYTFTVSAAGEKDPLKMEFTTPKYQEPKPDKPADPAKPAGPAK